MKKMSVKFYQQMPAFAAQEPAGRIVDESATRGIAASQDKNVAYSATTIAPAGTSTEHIHSKALVE